MFSFEVIAEDEGARAGNLITSHGFIKTPSFVAVGTLGAVNNVTCGDLLKTGTQVIIANAFHLHLQPGEGIIENMGGLHKFMGWKGPLMTDSGGFQAFSLGAGKETGLGKVASMFADNRDQRVYANLKKEKPLVKMDEHGIKFISYIDGSQHNFTPEHVMKIERKLGADIIMMLDECTSPLHNFQYTREAMARTHRWSSRALAEFQHVSLNNQAFFGIVQGGAYKELRLESAQFISEQDFNGYAIGGSLGNSKNEMHKVLEWTIPILKKDKPRHLLGIGEIEDIFEIVSRGIDLFDCVFPTKLAKTGTVFTKWEKRHRIHLFNNQYKEDPNPIDNNCNCYTCCNYPKGYIRHLFKIKDPLAIRLAAIHNLGFIESLMRQIRLAIRENRFTALRREWCQGN